MIGVDDGIVNGNYDFADLCFFIALILFVVEFVAAAVKKPIAFPLFTLALAFVALGLFVQ